MSPGTEDAVVRAAVFAVLVDNYRANGPRLELTVLADRTDAALGQVVAVCAELIDAGYVYGTGDPVHAIRLNDNGFAVANDALSLGLLERHEADGTT
ncbi:MAG: hypothetical protein IAI50_01450 [Candidatus Eremiobacteraeota bacterium]|nr:hypothetical protein [Candidatus Eremiobacteraeota bacterium]